MTLKMGHGHWIQYESVTLEWRWSSRKVLLVSLWNTLREKAHARSLATVKSTLETSAISLNMTCAKQIHKNTRSRGGQITWIFPPRFWLVHSTRTNPLPQPPHPSLYPLAWTSLLLTGRLRPMPHLQKRTMVSTEEAHSVLYVFCHFFKWGTEGVGRGEWWT